MILAIQHPLKMDESAGEEPADKTAKNRPSRKAKTRGRKGGKEG